MALLLSERRDPELKQGWWSGSTLYSISAPSLQLLAVVGIVVFLLWTSSYLNYKAPTINASLLLLLLPLVLLLVALYGRLVVPAPNVKVKHSHGEDGASSPWGLAALGTLVLVLVYYRPHLIFVVGIVFLYMYILSI